MTIAKQTYLFILLNVFISGCAAESDPELFNDVSHFATGVDGLVAVIDGQFKVTEKANKTALLDSLNLQFDLGGTPKITFRRLFTSEEMAARLTVLYALQYYAYDLRNAFAGGVANRKQALSVFSADKLRDLRPEDISLSHMMDRFQVKNLVSSLSGFADILLASKRKTELSKITKAAHPFIQKLALLLYLDIGSNVDQSSDCKYAPSVKLGVSNLEKISLCRGGLRGLMATAIAADKVTWRQRLQLISQKKAANTEKREKVIRHLFALENTGQLQDDTMSNIQLALIDLVNAHQQLVVIFAGDSLAGILREYPNYQNEYNATIVFAETVAALKVLAVEAGSLFSQTPVE